ncbi:MAG: ester cyclase [Actinomycetota bacterium]
MSPSTPPPAEAPTAAAFAQAWESRDPEALARLLAPGLTYRDPLGGQGREGLLGTATALFKALPDLTLRDVVTTTDGRGTAALRWTVTGTDEGGFGGNPPTGGRVALPMATFLAVEGGCVRAADCFWDHKTLLEQLGLEVTTMPPVVGPFHTGFAARATSGRRTRPGAVSLTWLVTRTPEDKAAFGAFVRDRVVPELLALPGFLSFLGGSIGPWHFTITAWETPGDVRGLQSLPSHREAIRWFFAPGGIGAAASSGVWVPERQNVLYVRCPSCGRMVDAAGGGPCADCGTALPEAAPDW